MVSETLPVNPSLDHINGLAAHYAAHILRLIPPADRAPIVAYGRCLVDGRTPSTGTVLRFFNALHAAGPTLPGYIGFVGRISTRPSVITRFEDGIAVGVASSHEAVSP